MCNCIELSIIQHRLVKKKLKVKSLAAQETGFSPRDGVGNICTHHLPLNIASYMAKHTGIVL